MLSAIKIKEEPLDEIEDSKETFKQVEAFIKQQTNAEVGEQQSVPSNFRIVEEQDSIITVSAADMRSDDEMRFIDSINNCDPNKFKGVCSKCLKFFTNRSQFLKHTKRNHCVTKQKCPVCPVTFIDATSMLNHLNLHRENFFFCSLHCGANFATLPLCEDHELKEHKIQATPKIRYKHFCSFCREGFKTELQMHVHWLQQTQGCGKLMQDIVLHSTNVANNYDDHINKSKNLFLDKQLKSPTTNSVSTIPITKLRLKYDTTPTNGTNKRQNNNDYEDTSKKRLKTFEKIKYEIESNQLPLNIQSDIKIKEEPADDYESTITSPLIPEVIIKTEEEDKTEEKEKNCEKRSMTNLIINNMIGPESNGKFIPIEELVTSENMKIEPHSQMKTFSINTLVNSNTNGKIINLNNSQNSPVLQTFSNNMSNINGKIVNMNNSQNSPVLQTVNNIMSNINGKIINMNNSQNSPVLQTINSNMSNINGKIINMNNSQGSPVLQTINNNMSNINGKIINMNNSQGSPVLQTINNNTGNINGNSSINKTIKINEGNLRLIKIAPAPLPVTNKSFGNLNFTNIKKCNTTTIMPFKLANSDIKPLPRSGLQIIKFLPNTQFISMKVNNNNNNLLGNKQPLVLKLKNTTVETCNNNNALGGKPPVVLKLHSSQTAAAQTTSLVSTSTLPIISNSTPKTVACNTSSANSNAVSIKLNSLEQNTTIDAEDFKKLQAEALIKAEEHRKNFYISKTRLMMIENIPEKKQLIDNMKQQIAEVETKTTEQIQSKPGGNFILNTKQTDEPVSLYLPILTTMDVTLVQARYKNPNYNYKWICPYCLKDYEIKTALKMHLIKAHNLNSRDMEKINVQAKPYLIDVIDEVVEDIKPEIKEEPLSQDSQDSQSLETYKIVDTISPSSPKLLKLTNIKQQRARYVCDKCGRTCSSKTMLNDHILANCSREPQYGCTECDKKFFSHGTLQCHMTIHTGELPHKCNYCDKRFRTRGQVKVHHRTHTGERPFFCQVCSQRFTHRETLIAHLSRHIGMKRYKCYGCDKHFSCISALKTHREIRADTCGRVKFNPRAIGPRVRVIRGNVIFEPQPEINPYLKSEDPKIVLSELQNHSEDSKIELKNQFQDSKSDLLQIQKLA